jgi:hypothetical protein
MTRRRLLCVAFLVAQSALCSHGWTDHNRNPKDPGSVDHSIYKKDGKKYTRDMDVHLPSDDGVHIREDNRSIVMTKIHYRVSISYLLYQVRDLTND